jgi:moderate conductance mechanosensitive channel
MRAKAEGGVPHRTDDVRIMARWDQPQIGDFVRGSLSRRVRVVALLSAILSLAAIAVARAELVATAPADAHSTLTSAEAERALDVLQDAAKRDELIETLRAIVKASPQPLTQPAATNVEPQIAADGFGADALLQASTEIGEFSSQIEQSVRAATKLPLFWRWLANTATNPQAQQLLLSVLWRAVTVALLALLAERVVQFALRRPLAVLETHASQEAIQTAPVEAPGADKAQALRLGRVKWLRMTLRRAPYAMARLVLELAPIAAFAAAGNSLLATIIGADSVARIAILALVNAYVVCRAVMSILRAFVGGSTPGTSLFALPAETAAPIETWTRRIVGVAVFGLALANVARALGLERPAYLAMVKLVILIPHLLLVVVILRCRRIVASFIRAPAADSGFLSILRNRFADVWHYVAIFADLALWAIWAFRIPNGYSVVAYYAAVAIFILVLARAAWAVALGGLDRAFHPGSGLLARSPTAEVLAARYRPVLHLALSTVIAIIAIGALLEVFGVDALGWFDPGHIGAILLSELSSVLLAIAVAVIVWEACNSAIERQLAHFAREGAYARAARLRTLLPMLRTALIVTILTIAGLTALSAIGVNIAPLLAGAGIVGIAVGFGSQKLVQDVVTGVFLLLENAMQVGDFVTVSGLSGTVENLSVRSIRLRAGDGSVHIIPFSAVTSVTNTNRGIGNAAISVNLAYDEDVDKAGEVLKQIAAEMRREPEFKTRMRGDLDLWGVDKVDGATVTIVGQIECTDSGRWPVQREFNRRMKIRFQELGMDIAYPAQTRFVPDEYFSRRRGRAGDAAE